jgi:uncharacterized protein
MGKLQLSEIWVYPIKSLAGISIKSTNVFQKGIQFDRRWMLVDENGTFITQRVHPKMALFKLIMHYDCFTILIGDKSIDLKQGHAYLAEPIHASIWNDQVIVHEVSEEHSRWFTNQLGFSCKLVAFPEENRRPVDPNFQVNQEHVSLADGYPFLIIGQASLDNLNSKLSEPLPINRFRPNFVFTGGEPHEEDTWRNVSIGETEFVGVKPCSRCVLTTVNQETGEKGIEPLQTLATYRKHNGKILFGQNLVTLNEGTVRVGDEITIHSFQENKIVKSVD